MSKTWQIMEIGMKRNLLCLVVAVVAVCVSIGSAAGDDWPCFTGPNHDNIAPNVKGLAAEWPKEGPKVVWEATLEQAGGDECFASPVVAGGKVFVMSRKYDKDTTTKPAVMKPTPDYVYCLNAADGKELWKHELPLHAAAAKQLPGNFKTCWNTPVVDGDLVYVRGGDGEIRALKTADGSVAWKWPGSDDEMNKFLNGDPEKKTRGASARDYGISAPSIVVDDLLIVPLWASFKTVVAAFDKKTGEKKWETPEIGCWQCSAGNFIPLTLGEKKVIVLSNVVLDVKTGKNIMALVKDKNGKDVPGTWGPGSIMWVSTWTGNKVITGFTVNEVKTKVDGKDVVSKPGSAGISCVEFSLNADGAVVTKSVWTYSQEGDNNKWQKDYGGPVVIGDAVYSFHGRGGPTIFCLSLADGKVLWQVEKAKHGLGNSNPVAADGKIFYQSGGQLNMIAADQKEYKELSSVKIGNGDSSPAIVGTQMFIRDNAGKVRCLDLKAQ
jgi:outer membrane protein assembly factor BamB